jgi:hypothetical protein
MLAMSDQALMNDWETRVENPLWLDDLRRGIWPRSFALWILAVWMALLVIRPWEALMPELGDWHMERVFAILALVVVIGSGKLRFLGSYQTTGLLLWILALAVSSLSAVDPRESWPIFYIYLTTFIFYIAIISVLRTPYQLFFMVACFVVVMAVYLGKSQWEYFFCGGGSFAMGVRRLKGIDVTYSHPNAVACSAVISLPFAQFLWKIRKEFTAGWPNLWRKCFPFGILAFYYIVVSSILLTNSRTGIFAFVLFMALAALDGKGIGKLAFRFACGAVALAILWMVMPESTKGRVANTWDRTSGPEAESAYVSGEGRVEGVKMGMKMFETFPIAGVGLGNFIPYRRANLDGVNLVAHNIIGGVLGETGLLGGAAFVFFLSGVFVNCRAAKRLAKQSPHPISRLLARLATACRDSMILLIFSGMFGDDQARAQIYWVAAFGLLSITFLREMSTEEAIAAENVAYPSMIPRTAFE